MPDSRSGTRELSRVSPVWESCNGFRTKLSYSHESLQSDEVTRAVASLTGERESNGFGCRSPARRRVAAPCDGADCSALARPQFEPGLSTLCFSRFGVLRTGINVFISGVYNYGVVVKKCWNGNESFF